MYMKKNKFDFDYELDMQKKENKDYYIKRLSSKAMELKTSEGIYVQYVYTVVFKQILNTGGWHTNTTKKWINEYLPQ